MKLILFILLLVQTTSFSQEHKKDSLIQILNKTNSDEKKITLYLELSKSYRKTDIDSALIYANKGHLLAQKLEDKKAIAENLSNLGNLYVTKNQFDIAKKYYNASLKLYKEDNNVFEYCRNSMRIGNIDFLQNKYQNALTKFHRCLVIAEKNNFTALIPHLNNNIGYLFYELEDYKDALKYLKISYELFSKTNDLYNMANVLSSIASINNKLGKSDLAIEQHLETITLFQKNGNWEDLISPYNALVKIYTEKKDYTKAEKYSSIALQNLNKKGSPDFIGPISKYKTDLFFSVAKLYFDKKETNKSIYFAHKSLKLAKENSFNKDITDNAKILYQIYRKQNRIDSALFYNDIYIKYNEIYISESDIKKVTQIKMQYKFDDIMRKKEIENFEKQATSKRNELLFIGISIFTVLGIIIMILLYLYQKSKTVKLMLTKENLELEKVALNQDIDYKSKELASKTIYLLEKNEFIQSLAQKLKILKPEIKKENQGTFQEIINELNQNSSNKVWNEFEIRFKEVHSSFYDNLNKLHPDLTPNEIKICAFLRLNMSTKDISAITHQSVKSINMARFRLRKKLNIESEDNLINYLIQLK